MKRDLKEKLSDMSQKDLVRWISWTVVAASVVLVTSFALYFVVFSGGLSDDREAWGQFGDFVGGTINPILGFLTIIALALTLILQNRQLAMSASELALSRSELELTRQELSRSAQAQESSEQALRAQAHTAEQSAKLTAANFLLDHYKSELKGMIGQAYVYNDPRLAKMQELERRKAVLESMLDALFEEVTKES